MNKISDVTKQIVDLQRMELPALKAKFAELYGFPATINNTRSLRKRLAYRIQELHFGGLTAEEDAYLEEIAMSDPQAQVKPAPPKTSELQPGARICRTWRGKQYEVVVLEDGRYSYEGRVFRSLSGVAAQITGGHWNGRAFFGLK